MCLGALEYLPEPPVLYFAEPGGEREYPYKHWDGSVDTEESRPVFRRLTVDTPLIQPSPWTNSGVSGHSPQECENTKRAGPLFLQLSSPHDLEEFVKHRRGPLMNLIEHLRKQWDECFENTQLMVTRQSWGFHEEPSCVGRYVFGVVTLISYLARVHDCKNLECERRRQALDAAAPRCGWPAFRTLVVAVLSCWMPNLLYVLQEMIGYVLFRSDRFLCLDVGGMAEIFRWGIRVAYGVKFSEHLRISTQDSRFEELVSQLNHTYERAAIEATDDSRRHSVCPNRLWNVSLLGTRGVADIPHINSMLVNMWPLLADVLTSRHADCTQQSCLFSFENSTLVKQAHKCALGNCEDEIVFPPELLNEALARAKPKPPANTTGDDSIAVNGSQQADWEPTSWRTSIDNPVVCGRGEKYMAISHVWSDGTGAGMKMPGQVNRCLLEYFLKLAEDEGCDGLWWDSISIPTEREARKTAINNMLRNYEEAAVTLVHDNELVTFEWKDDGSPAVALILSAWFTRGWTAAELFASRNHAVKVVFKNPDPAGPPLVKDLDRDILAWDPWSIEGEHLADSKTMAEVSLYRVNNMLDDSNKVPKLGHFIATDIIRRLRAGAGLDSSADRTIAGRSLALSIRDLIINLRSRTTSWARDRLIIPGLMCLPSLDSTSTGPDITRQLLLRFGTVFINDLFHGEVTITNHGPWSWCPPSVFDFGVSRSSLSRHRSGLCYIDQGGVVSGQFSAFSLTEDDVIIPYGNHPATVARISNALLDRSKCLLLCDINQVHRQYILARPVRVVSYARRLSMSCEWVGCVHLGATRDLGDTSELAQWGLQAGPSHFRVRDQPLLNGGRLLFLFGLNQDKNGRPLPPMNARYAFSTVLNADRARQGPLHNLQWILTSGQVSSEVRKYGVTHHEPRWLFATLPAHLYKYGTSEVMTEDNRSRFFICTVKLDPWPEDECNYISTALFDKSSSLHSEFDQIRKHCDVNHRLSGECHGTIELPWSFPYSLAGQTPIFCNIFRTRFHILSKDNMLFELIIGRDTLERQIMPLCRETSIYNRPQLFINSSIEADSARGHNWNTATSE